MRDARVLVAAWVSACAGLTAAGGPLSGPGASGQADDAARERFERGLAGRLLAMMPESHRVAIMAAESGLTESPLLTGPFAGAGLGRGASGPFASTSDHELVSAHISAEAFDALPAVQRDIVREMAYRLERNLPMAAMCFAPGATGPYVDAINSIMLARQQITFQQTNRWSATALSGGGLVQGQPTVLTYSFVPDGTFCPNIIGVTGNSNLRAWLNTRYPGGQAVWQPLFDQTFDRWSQLTGLSYVFEPNDDGVTLNQNAGQVGRRGDVRIAAITIDGNSGTLAYNNFPQDGDMVFDSADNFFNTTTGNSLRLRNVIAHEHGHGIGMFHVCPANQTKLMEPFVSTAYDGPQLDDILNGQRHYGDPLESNDTAATATPLATPAIGVTASTENVSLDDETDVDFYRITVTDPVGLTARVSPDAATYLQGPQDQACAGASATSTNYNTVLDLAVDIIDSDGVTVLASANATGAGSAESVTTQLSPGDYYVRVRGTLSDASIQIQRYQLDLESVGAFITFVDPIPSTLTPGVPFEFLVDIVTFGDQFIGSPQLVFVENGQTQIANLVTVDADTYRGTLPAIECLSSVQFRVRADTVASGTLELPEGGGFITLTAVETARPLFDTFTSVIDPANNWSTFTAGDNATSGRWQRGTPTSTSAQPGAGVDDAFCYATGLSSAGGAGSNDIDNGRTTLTSPRIDLSGASTATVSYARWYSNTQGNAPNADTFVVQISSDDGVTWTNLEVVGPAGGEVSGGWFNRSFAVENFVALTSTVRVRFIASDEGTGSLVEAAVDAFAVETQTCPAVVCRADIDGNGTNNIFDILAFFAAFGAGGTVADFTNNGSLDIFDIFAFFAEFGSC